jgi:predicted phosphodiesterase
MFEPQVTPEPKRILFVPDAHVPNNDYRAMGVLFAAAKVWKPHILVILGDWADFDSVSLHEPDEVKHTLLREEADVARWTLDYLAETCGLQLERRIFIEGNHEQRLARYLARRAPALWDALSVGTLLGLDARWEFVPYRSSLRIGRLHLTHDTGKSGRNAHRQSATSHLGSTIIGHTHRMAYDVTGTFDGMPYLSAMFGWLGDRKLAGGYTHEANAAEWAHGFGTGLMLANGIVHVQPVPIIDGRAVVGGTLV